MSNSHTQREHTSRQRGSQQEFRQVPNSGEGGNGSHQLHIAATHAAHEKHDGECSASQQAGRDRVEKTSQSTAICVNG
jgi:hypothetical protein